MTWGEGAIVAVCGVAGKILFDWLSGKKEARPRESTSGGQDVSFWMGEFQDVKDKVQELRELVSRGDIDRGRIEAQVDSVQHTVDRIEQKINSRRR
jgi:hypothetical protein